MKEFREKHQNRRIFNKAAHGFFYWKRLTLANKIIKAQQQNNCLNLSKRAFKTWKNNFLFMKKLRRFQRKKMEIRKFFAFHFLKKYVGLRDSKKNAKVTYLFPNIYI